MPPLDAMSRCISTLILWFALGATAWSEVVLHEPWATGYVDDDAQGNHVIGHWHFDLRRPPFDSAENTSNFTLHGSARITQGRFGDALCLERGEYLPGKQPFAVINPTVALDAPDGFSSEVWVRPQRKVPPGEQRTLLDKSAGSSDFSWHLLRLTDSPFTRMVLVLHCEQATIVVRSEPFELTTRDWCHLAFTYDGVSSVSFFVNGIPAGKVTSDPVGPLLQGPHALHIGASMRQAGQQFEGLIDEVRVCRGELDFEPVSLAFRMSRRVWQRMEEARGFHVDCSNHQKEAITEGLLHLTYADRSTVVPIERIDPGTTFAVKLGLHTFLKPGRYLLKAELTWNQGRRSAAQTTEFEVAPKPIERMPLMFLDQPPSDLGILGTLGFTHCMGLGHPNVPSGPDPVSLVRRVPQPRGGLELLDRALAGEMRVIGEFELAPQSVVGLPSVVDPRVAAVKADGNPYDPSVADPANPGFAGPAQILAQKRVVDYRDHIAFQSFLIDPGPRSRFRLSFAPHNLTSLNEAEITVPPHGITSKWGIDLRPTLDPSSERVIAPDHPVLQFYRWYWNKGEGLSGIHQAVAAGQARRGERMSIYFSIFPEALEQPSIGAIDSTIDVLTSDVGVIGNPSLTGYHVERMLSMSRAVDHHPKVLPTIPLLLARNEVAPMALGSGADPSSEWEFETPRAEWFTVPSDHLKTSVWTALSKPVMGLGFTGTAALEGESSGVAGPDRSDVQMESLLNELIDKTIEPLGNTLRLLQKPVTQIAVLESFTSQVLSGEAGPPQSQPVMIGLWRALEMGHIEADILFEEELLAGGLDGRTCLILPACFFLTRPVHEALREFQQRGGVVIADGSLCSGVQADVTLEHLSAGGLDPILDEDLRELSDELRAACDGAGWSPVAESDDPNVIVHTMRYGETLYVFAINNHRRAGGHVGHHGRLRDRGMHATTKISILEDSGSVYDLTESRMVMTQLSDSGLGCSWTTQLGPGEGRLFMITPRPLLNLNLDVPERASTGGTLRITASLATSSGAPLEAAVPVHVQIRDASGQDVEGTGFYGSTEDGLLVEVPVASNEETGSWNVTVRELASGMSHTRWLTVEK